MSLLFELVKKLSDLREDEDYTLKSLFISFHFYLLPLCGKKPWERGCKFIHSQKKLKSAIRENVSP